MWWRKSESGGVIEDGGRREDGLSQIGTQARLRYDIHGPPKELGERILQADQLKETLRRAEVRNQVYVRVWTFLAPGRRSKDPKPRYVVFPAELAESGRVELDHTRILSGQPPWVNGISTPQRFVS